MQIVNLVQSIRNLNLMKKPSVRGTIDWVKSVKNLKGKNTKEALEESIGVVIKTENDKKRVIKEFFDK